MRITTQRNPCNHYREWVCSELLSLCPEKLHCPVLLETLVEIECTVQYSLSEIAQKTSLNQSKADRLQKELTVLNHTLCLICKASEMQQVLNEVS